MRRGLYGFASLKEELGVEAGRSWFILEGESILHTGCPAIRSVWL
jgi:hypothetical protein